VQVTGALLVDEEQRPMNYAQTFQLLPDGQGSYFVFNDIFRLIYNVSEAVAQARGGLDSDFVTTGLIALCRSGCGTSYSACVSNASMGC